MAKGIIILTPKGTRRPQGRLVAWTVDPGAPVSVGDRQIFDDPHLDGLKMGDIVEYFSTSNGECTVKRILEPRGLGNFSATIQSIATEVPNGAEIKVTAVTEANPFNVPEETKLGYNLPEVELGELRIGGTVDCIPTATDFCVLSRIY